MQAYMIARLFSCCFIVDSDSIVGGQLDGEIWVSFVNVYTAWLNHDVDNVMCSLCTHCTDLYNCHQLVKVHVLYTAVRKKDVRMWLGIVQCHVQLLVLISCYFCFTSSKECTHAQREKLHDSLTGTYMKGTNWYLSKTTYLHLASAL